MVCLGLVEVEIKLCIVGYVLLVTSYVHFALHRLSVELLI